MPLVEALLAGMTNVHHYLSAHVLACLIPAFMIAGALMVFLRKEIILRYFGADVAKYKSYTVASVCGTVLAVCSCTILPLFAGIHRRGSGIGPATAFLFSGPAINILAITYTARALGIDIGIARAAAAITLSIVLGIIMGTIFKRNGDKPSSSRFTTSPQAMGGRSSGGLLLFLLAALLVVGMLKIWIPAKLILIAIMGLVIVTHLRHSYSALAIREWLGETWVLARKIFPILILGTFIIGFVSYYLPPETFIRYLGKTSPWSCFLGSVIGGILYMPTLLEVPIIGSTFGYTSGLMASGPALSLLLAGPAVSLPSLLVLDRILGIRKTAAYILIVVVLSTIAGFLFGTLS